MATYNIIKMKSFSPFHVGTGKENYDFSAAELHSDTLSAGLAAIAIQQNKIEENEVENFIDSFKISSAFPFWKDWFFLPKLQSHTNITIAGKEEFEYRKKLKKITFIESQLWNKLIQGEKIEVEENQVITPFLLPIEIDKLSIEIDEPKKFKVIKSLVHQRVTIPHDRTKNPEPFFFEWKYFRQDAGLYAIVDVGDDKFDFIFELFKDLGEYGIGTDKSVGGGKFEVEKGKITIDDITDFNAQVLLSLYIPTEEELDALRPSEANYSLLLRGGYMSGSNQEKFRHLRKKSVYMFNVGSTFPITQELKGTIVNLAPEWNDPAIHPVYRSGKPIVIRIKM